MTTWAGAGQNTWNTYGSTWNVDPNFGFTSQGQTIQALGVERVSGTASASQVQKVTGMAAEAIRGTAAVSQVQTMSVVARIATGSNGHTSQGQRAQAVGAIIIGSNSGAWSTTQTWAEREFPWGHTTGTDQQAQTASGYSFDMGYGFGETSQSLQSASGEGDLSITSAAATAQRQDALRGSGRITYVGQAQTAGPRQSARARGRMVVGGAAATTQRAQAIRVFGTGKHITEPRAALAKLLKYPHRAVFDKAPDTAPVVLFDESYEGRLSWRINETVLEVTLEGFTRYYDMLNASVFDLVARIRASGIGVRIMDSEFSPLSAMVLVDESTTPRTDMDPILGFRSLLWALLYAYAHQTALGRYQVAQALRQMIVGQAEGYWLDLWGKLYDVPRLPGETDPHMQPRIAQEAFRVRVNGPGIEQAILDATGWDVRIEEPWKEVFTLDESALSGIDKLYDGGTIGYHLIRPVSRDTVDWRVVMPIIDRNRAAGVLVSEAQSRRAGLVAYGVDPDATVVQSRQHRMPLPYQDRQYLDYSRIEDVPVLNYQALHQRIDILFRSTLVPYIDAPTMDNTTIEDGAVPNNAARHFRDAARLSMSELDPLPTVTSKHVSRDNIDRYYSEVLYEDRHLLDQYPVEAETMAVLPGSHGREIRRFSGSEYVGQTWQVARTWANANATWQSLGVVIDTTHTRLS